jgi:hypothetical protein
MQELAGLQAEAVLAPALEEYPFLMEPFDGLL